MLKVVGVGAVEVWRYSVALGQRIWCPERQKSTGTEVGGGGGGRYGGASVFIMKGEWEGFVRFENILFTKVDNVCRQIDVCLPFMGLGVGGV